MTAELILIVLFAALTVLVGSAGMIKNELLRKENELLKTKIKVHELIIIKLTERTDYIGIFNEIFESEIDHEINRGTENAKEN